MEPFFDVKIVNANVLISGVPKNMANESVARHAANSLPFAPIRVTIAGARVTKRMDDGFTDSCVVELTLEYHTADFV